MLITPWRRASLVCSNCDGRRVVV